MSPCVPVTTGTLPHTPVIPRLSPVIQASLAPSPYLKKDGASCLYAQETLELNTATEGSLEPSPSTQVSGKASLYTKATLGQSTSVQGIEGHSACTAGTLESNKRSDQKELGACPPTQVSLVTSFSSQGTLGTSSSAQEPLGPSLSAQGSLKLSSPTQEMEGIVSSAQSTLKHQTSSQEAPMFFPSTQPALQGAFPSSGSTGCVLSIQKTHGSLWSSPEYVEHSPSATGAQEQPLAAPRTLGPLMSSKGSKELPTVADGTLPVHSSLSSVQWTPDPSVNSGVGESYQYSQSTLGPLPHVVDGVDSSQSDPGTVGPLPVPLVPGRHSTSTQGAAGSFSSNQGYVAPFKSALEPLKLSISAQAVLHTSLSTEGSLQSSAPSAEVPEPNTNSPSTGATSGTSPSTVGHMGHFASPQVTPSSSHSDEGVVRLCQSAQGTLTMLKSTQGTLGISSSPQHTGGHYLSAEGTLGLSTSAQQTAGIMPSTDGTLGFPQNSQVIPGSLPSDQRSLGISLSVEGSLKKFQAAERLVHDSPIPKVPPGLSVSPQVTPATLLSDRGSRKHPTSSQIPKRTSQSALNSLQHPASVPGFLNPSQSEQSTPAPLLSPPGTGIHGPSASVSQKMFPGSATSGYPEPLPYVGGPLKLSLSAQGTLCPFSSSVGDLDPLDSLPGNLESSQPAQRNLGHLSYVREPVRNSPSVPVHRATSPLNKVPRGHSPHVPGDPAPVLSPRCLPQLTVSAKCSLRPLASSKETLESLSSSASILGTLQSMQCQEKLSHVGEKMEISPPLVGTSVCLACAPDHMGPSYLEQGSQTISHCSQGAVGSCLSTQGYIRQPTATQRTPGYRLSSQGISNSSSLKQGTGSQSTSAQSPLAHSPSIPVSQRDTHHAQKMTGAMKFVQGSPKISLNARGSVKPLTSPCETPRYSSSPGACKMSAATPGHVVSDEGILGLSISAQARVSPFLTSQRHLETSLSVEGTSDLSTPTQGTLGHSVSSHGPPESLQTAQSVKQTNPSVADSSGSLPSSMGHKVISLSGEGTLGTASSSLGPLAMSLSVPMSSFLSFPEAGGPCLSSQGTLKVSTSTHDNLATSNSSKGHLGDSPSTPVTLGSSPSAQVDLGVSLPVSRSLRTPVSYQGVLGTLTCTQGAMKLSSDRQGKTEPLPYAQDNLGLGFPSLGTQGPSQFSQREVKVLPSDQGNFKTALSTTGPIKIFYLPQNHQDFSLLCCKMLKALPYTTKIILDCPRLQRSV